MDERELTIEKAIADYRVGVLSSMAKCTDAYGIPRSTFAARLRGSQSARSAHEHQQRLSPEQEVFLKNWILEEDGRGFPPSHTRLREMAARVLYISGDQAPLGKLWVNNFIRRNPDIATKIGRRIDEKKSEYASLEQVQAFLNLFEATRIRLNIRAEDVYNMDERGTVLAVKNSSVVAHANNQDASGGA